MVEKSTFTQPIFIDNGTVNWQPVRDAFTEIQETLNEHRDEIIALAQHQTYTVSKMVQTRGKHVLVNSGKHIRCKVTNAYAIVHDNIPEEISVILTGLSMPVKFSESEKKGSGKIFELVPNAVSHFVEDIAVELTANRRVSVYATLESIEERD